MFTPFTVKSEEMLVAMCRRWYSISKTKRAQAIAKQHGYEDPSEIFHRKPDGRCIGWDTYIAEYCEFTIYFDYWGQINMDDAILFSEGTKPIEVNAQVIADTEGALRERYEEPMWHDECDRDWEYIPED